MSFPNWNSVANRNAKFRKYKRNKYSGIDSFYFKPNIDYDENLKSKSYTACQVKTIIKLAHKLGKPEMLMEFKINNQYDASLAIRRLKKLVNAI